MQLIIRIVLAAYSIFISGLAMLGLYDFMWHIFVILIIGILSIFRFYVPVTIAALYGAIWSLHWPWYISIMVVLPGFILLVPFIFAIIFSRFSQYPSERI